MYEPLKIDSSGFSIHLTFFKSIRFVQIHANEYTRKALFLSKYTYSIHATYGVKIPAVHFTSDMNY